MLARKTPKTTEYSIELLNARGWKTVNTPEVMSRACHLSIDDFAGKPLPQMLERVKIKLCEQCFELQQIG